ncbi:MAG: BBE domain-containing protein, partial [Thermomicrobiales bacterium]|nr:BBE domain-containing protein [Thermomicrobiales bacterium]
QHAYYGSNFERLVEVKQAWDPDALFRFPQSIPTRI